MPMTHLQTTSPELLDGQPFDLVVIGGTPGGIACAVRAAREGLRVLLVNHTRHLGGFITSGAGGWEAPYDGMRCPLYAEMIRGASEYYCAEYGENSPEHLSSLPSKESRRHIDRPKVEPRIAEELFTRMLNGEGNLHVLLGHAVWKANSSDRMIHSVTLTPTYGGTPVCVVAKIFVDAMYEGDLAQAAGVKMQQGREARETYNEPHAGVIYTRKRLKKPGQRGWPLDADRGNLNIRYNPHASGEIVEGPHSGEADSSVMAYNFRLILTKNPSNRIPVPQPLNASFDGFSGRLKRSIVPNIPGDKIAWNGGGRLIGPQNEYPAADWQTRERIAHRYLEAALRELWLVQNAPGIAEEERAFWSDYGLAADEFSDNGHVPYEIYVREARRMVGRYVFTEHDNKLAPGIARTPVHADSIGITDWPLDSVACLNRSWDGSSLDGVFFLAEESRPAQIPYRCLLPNEFDNLLVPVALSASHVGWGALRLEPVWMQTGEAAGWAAVLSLRYKTTPGELDPDLLVRQLVRAGFIVTFFNDTEDSDASQAAQYFGTKGYFAGYDANLEDALDPLTELLWRRRTAKIGDTAQSPNTLAAALSCAYATKPAKSGTTRRALLEEIAASKL